MARKNEFIRWGKISAYLGGILFIIGGLVLLINHFMDRTLEGSIEYNLIVKSSFILQNINSMLVIAFIGIVLGALVTIAINLHASDLARGIILIVLAIIGLGIPGLLTCISGILYIISSTKKR